MAMEDSDFECNAGDQGTAHEARFQGHDSIVWSAIVFTLCLGVSDVVLIEAACMFDKSPPEGNEQKADSYIGWPSAAGAAILFGSVFLPYSLRSLDRAHPIGRGFFIVMFSSLGNGLAHFTMIFVMRILGLLTRRLTATQVLCGFMGGILLTGAATLSFYGSRCVGVATVAPVLSSTAMTISYLWGIIAFKESVKDVGGCCLGLACLMAGAAVCSVAQTSAPQRLKEMLLGDCNELQALARFEERGTIFLDRSISRDLDLSVTHSMGGRSLAVAGVLMAVTAGTFDGTLMVPYKLFNIQFSSSVSEITDTTRVGSTVTSVFNQTHHIDHVVKRAVKRTMKPVKRTIRHTIDDVPLVEDITSADTATVHSKGASHPTDGSHSKDAAYVYLQGLSSTLLALSGMIWLALRTAYRGCAEEFALQQRTCMLPGVVAGVLWAMGNMCSIRASQYLGVAVGFPLCLTCCGVSAIWGIALLGEMRQPSQRVVCFIGVSCVFLGGGILSAYGTE